MDDATFIATFRCPRIQYRSARDEMVRACLYIHGAHLHVFETCFVPDTYVRISMCIACLYRMHVRKVV